MGRKRSALQRQAWNDTAEIDKLKKLYTDGLSMEEMGKQLGRTRNSVLTKCRALKLPERDRPAGGQRQVLFDAPRLEILEKSFRAKMTIDQMADACDVTRDQLRKKLDNLGLSIAKRDGISPRGTRRATTSVRGKDGNTANLNKIRAVVAYQEPPRDPLAPDSARDDRGALFSLATIPNSGRCKWPHGDVASSDFHLCGQHAPGGAYCEYHTKRRRAPSQPLMPGAMAFGNSGAGRVFP